MLTTLSKAAMPMIRYRTRDITALVPEPCGCGRTLRRIRRIGRRSDDMFLIRGVNVFPSQVETALLQVEGTLPHYPDRPDPREGARRDGGPGRGESRGLLRQGRRAGEPASDGAVDHVLGLRVRVQLVAPRTIARSEGKAKRVLDKRSL